MASGTSAALDDLSCEVAQRRLQMLAEEGGLRASRSAGSPFVMGLGSCASAIFTREGDVFPCNYPLRGGIHPTDFGCFRPIFVDGELAYFTGMNEQGQSLSVIGSGT